MFLFITSTKVFLDWFRRWVINLNSKVFFIKSRLNLIIHTLIQIKNYRFLVPLTFFMENLQLFVPNSHLQENMQFTNVAPLILWNLLFVSMSILLVTLLILVVRFATITENIVFSKSKMNILLTFIDFYKSKSTFLGWTIHCKLFYYFLQIFILL